MDSTPYTALTKALSTPTSRRQALSQNRFLIGPDLRAAHMLWAVAGAARDIGVDWTWAQHRDADIGALQFVFQRLGQ